MDGKTQRLDKYLSSLGVCSRRNVEFFLKKHIVEVNRKRVKESGTRVNPSHDSITLNGKQIKPPALVYYLLHKSKGVISTARDELGREDVTSLIPSSTRIYPVGRLDKDTTGLLILTNDGALANLLTHPRYEVHKTYKLTVNGKVSQNQMRVLRNGVILSDGKTSPAVVNLVQDGMRMSVIEITIHEGRNRQIRRMCEAVKLQLMSLSRIKLGSMSLGNLKEGKYRELTSEDVNILRSLAKDVNTTKTE